MPGNHTTTLEQRIEIWERAQGNETDAQIATALGLRPVTVRKWRRRAKQQGRRGLASVMGCPARGVLCHFPLHVPQVLRTLRQSHPGWGPKTLRLECLHDARWCGQSLPSPARIAAFLKAEKLTRRYERHAALSQPPPPVLTAPHLEWELDAQGVRQVIGVGKICVINLGDPYSHVRTGSHACVGKIKANTADYPLALRRAFLRYGLPRGLSLDHDHIFFDNTSASPYPSQLHLWLMAWVYRCALLMWDALPNTGSLNALIKSSTPEPCTDIRSRMRGRCNRHSRSAWIF